MITGKDEVKIRFNGEILWLQIEGEGENITPDIRDKNGKSFMLLKKGKTYHVGKKPLDLLSFTRCEIKTMGNCCTVTGFIVKKHHLLLQTNLVMEVIIIRMRAESLIK